VNVPAVVKLVMTCALALNAPANKSRLAVKTRLRMQVNFIGFMSGEFGGLGYVESI
jgi:hypothetical protein